MTEEQGDLRHRRTNSAQYGVDRSPQKVMEELAFLREEARRNQHPRLVTALALEKTREIANRLKTEFVQQVEGEVSALVGDLMATWEGVARGVDTNGEQPHPKPRRPEGGHLPEKVFVARRSLLTELLEINHIQTIYHIFVAIMIVFSMNTIVYDLLETGYPVLDFQLLYWAFGQFQTVMSTWVVMQGTTIALYIFYKCWAEGRPDGPGTWWDWGWLGLYATYQCAFMVLPVQVIHYNKLPIASAACVAAEQTRFIMKTHAFVRENAADALRGSPPEDSVTQPHYRRTEEGKEEARGMPDFSKYLYFLFSPTLVYRHSYPRTARINWGFVMTHFLQVAACCVYLFYIFTRFLVPTFKNFSEDHVTARQLLLSMFGCMMPGILVLVIAFYAILHCWMNAWAEMLRFADRQFYKDWWNSTSFSNYYRTWNVVVHDWLYTYVYRDCHEVLATRNRAAMMATVFLLSAVFHEYILVLIFGFCYPVLFVEFAGCGYLFIFITQKRSSRAWNVLLWLALIVGCGSLMALYSLEWYARKRCPPVMDSWLDFVVPRSWFCDFDRML